MFKLRNRHFFVLDILALALIPFLALALRLESLDWSPQVGASLLFYCAVSVLVELAVFYRLGLYDRYWYHAGINDLTLVPIAVGLSTTILTVGFIAAHPALDRIGLAMYRTVPLIGGLLACLVVGGLRVGSRVIHEWAHRHSMVGGRRVLIVGAGQAGMLIAHEMRANPQLNMEPVGFVDDDTAKVGTYIQGLPVLGLCRDILEITQRDKVQRIVVTLPSIPLRRQQEIIDLCRRTGIATESIPGIYEILAGSKTISRLPKIDINLLLRREPVVIDQTEVAACLTGASVLVTGAGGSIGSELCRQVARFDPREIILLGHGENSIFEINLDLHLSFPNLLTYPVIADIRDAEQIYRIIKDRQPDVIFHAAAHKHVPLMEANTREAITNNVLGTQNVLQAAQECGVERFVMISTDKAINPTSIMGASKRLAELLVVAAAHDCGRPYLAVRFGNVLGSRGSVIPVFQRQIAAGGPITITHPDMCRYFMTIPEAVQLVLQAMVLGQGGEVFVLDMGEPVRILDLATDLIRMAGLEPERDIQIEYVGIRPGEKLREELFLDTEDYQRTKHRRIFVAKNGETDEAAKVARLVNLRRQMLAQAAVERIQAGYPQFLNQAHGAMTNGSRFDPEYYRASRSMAWKNG
jgi:FlaA1/EpsC-like NDP-sugar epimerase